MLFEFISIPKTNLSNSFSLADVFSLLSSKYERLHNTITHNFGPNGIYILALFVAFIALILVIYIKSIIDTFQAGNNETDENSLTPDFEQSYSSKTTESFHENDTLSLSKSIPEIPVNEYEDTRPRLAVPDKKIKADSQDKEQERKRREALIEKEKEISRDLVRSSASSDDILQLKNTLKQQTNKVILDWNKNKTQPQTEAPQPQKLHYEQQAEPLDKLVCLIINMLGRNVSAEKIAQALYYRNGGQNSSEDLIQMVYTVRDFISLCNTGKFDTLPNREQLPTNNESLFHWAKGDNTPCLSLLEKLIQQKIASAEHKTDIAKEMTLAQAAKYACIFGTIASINNPKLALNSFELALDLAPQNINAWSRAGDMHWTLGNYEQAIIAYQAVLKNNTPVIYDEQKANAQRKLSLYYSQLGKEEKAVELNEQSQEFYNSFGLNTDLTKQENAIYDFIFARSHDNLQQIINQLLKKRKIRYA